MTPQARQIMKHLATEGSITQVIASALYKARALPRRVCDLKAAGFKIQTELRTDATGQRYAYYSMPLEERRRVRMTHKNIFA